MESAGGEESRLLGSAVRPLLIIIILRLRPELDPVTVGGAVERIALSGEENLDAMRLWQEIETVLTELAPS